MARQFLRNWLVVCVSFSCFLVSFASAGGRSYIDIAYHAAEKNYGVFYYLNNISGLGMAKFCIPVSSAHGSLLDVVFVYKDEFQVTSKPMKEGNIYNEYLISFGTKTENPKIILSIIYQNFSKKTEINIEFNDFGGGAWKVADMEPVAELACIIEQK